MTDPATAPDDELEMLRQVDARARERDGLPPAGASHAPVRTGRARAGDAAPALVVSLDAVRAAQAPRSCGVCGRPVHGALGPVVCEACDRRAHDAAEARASAARRERRLAAWSATVPKRYADASFEAPDVLRARVRDHAAIALAQAARSTTVTLVGGAGSGKSTLGAAIARGRALAGGKPPFWVRAVDLASARRGHRLGDGDAPLVRRAHEAGVLVIDDVGQDEPTTFARALHEVLFARHDDARDTIVTTGFTADAIAERYGDGIARRLFEDCTIQLRKVGR